MPGYFGTEMQQRLQAQAEASVEFIHATHGACQIGRIMGCDDPDQFGWERIEEFIQRDCVFGFRLIPVHRAEEIATRLASLNCRLDTWDVFLAGRDDALAAAEAVVSRGLPDGLFGLAKPTDPESTYMVSIQSLMATAGIVPFSGSLLVGVFGPATTVAVGSEDGTVVATAYGYLPHNTHSPYHRHAWGGLVAVAESQRGKGLSNYINAKMILGVFRDLDATHIYELVSASNLPSRRMVEACGLVHEPSLICGAAIPSENARYTR